MRRALGWRASPALLFVSPALLFVSLALCATSCTQSARWRAPRNEAERTLLVHESDPFGKQHGISASSPEGTNVERVPDPVAVDIDSALGLAIRPPSVALPAGEGERFLLKADDDRKREADLHKLLEALDGYVQSHKAALESWQRMKSAPIGAVRSANDVGSFAAERRATGAAEQLLIERVGVVWPEGTPAADDVDKTLEHLDRTPDELQQFVQAELDRTDARLREAAQSAEQKKTRIRIEAFYLAAGQDPTPIHVPGYDSLAEGKLERRDRFGVDLSETERVRLEELMKSARELAAIAESVRKHEIELSEAFKKASSDSARKIAELLAEANAMAHDLEPAALRARVERLKSALDAYWNDVKARTQTLAAARLVELKKTGEAALAKALANADGPAALMNALARLEEVRKLASDPRPENLIALAGAAKDAVKSLGDALKLRDTFGPALTELTTALETQLTGLDTEIGGVARDAWNASGTTGAKHELEELSKLAARARGLVQFAANLVDPFQKAPINDPLRVPEALELDLESAPPATIDLRRAPLHEGDELTLRTTLIDAQDKETSGEARLRMERFGWHAWLAPSVVLVTPDQLAGAEDTVRFAPALSWLLTYSPREEEKDTGADLLRGLQPSFGIHAVFLSYVPDEDSQLGLGVTLSLRKDLLQVGYGWNLMADSKSEGGNYFFIGSSLIPLLQALSTGTTGR